MYHSKRFNKQLQETVQRIIAERFPHLGFISVSGVLVRPDKKTALIFVYAPGEGKSILNALNDAPAMFRSELKNRMVLRHILNLTFRLDTETPRIDTVLEKLES